MKRMSASSQPVAVPVSVPVVRVLLALINEIEGLETLEEHNFNANECQRVREWAKLTTALLGEARRDYCPACDKSGCVAIETSPPIHSRCGTPLVNYTPGGA